MKSQLNLVIKIGEENLNVIQTLNGTDFHCCGSILLNEVTAAFVFAIISIYLVFNLVFTDFSQWGNFIYASHWTAIAISHVALAIIFIVRLVFYQSFTVISYMLLKYYYLLQNPRNAVKI